MLLFVVAFTSFIFYSVHAQTSAQQVQALKNLYDSTGGAKWRVPWTFTGDPCANFWFGVTCYSAGPNDQRIFKLVLQGNNLIGTLPDISGLSYMQYLYLSGNYLEGTIPSSLGGLSQLQQLGLDKNLLTGGFPVFTSQALTELFLQDNQFTGPLDPLGHISSLQYLYLSRNNLTGTIPDIVANMFTLQQIGFDSNRLSGTIPAALGARQNYLQSFFGQNNTFSGAFPTNLCNVQNCDISGGSAFTCPHPACCHIGAC